METEFGNAYKTADKYWVISGGEYRGKYYHRLVIEKFYNIKLPDDWDVHHDDENKDNNEIWNLIPMPHSEHVSLHNRNRSPETKQKISDAMKGEKHPMYGKKHSLESLQKMSESHKRENLSPETIKKMSKPEPHIRKDGFDRNGNQVYALIVNGKIVMQSIYLKKLEKKLQEYLESEETVQTSLTDKEVKK